MSPEIESPRWIKYALRIAVLCATAYVFLMVGQYLRIRRTLHEVAAHPFAFESGAYGEDRGGLWFVITSPVPDEMIFSGDLSLLADDGYRYTWRPFVATGVELNDHTDRHYIQPPMLLAPFANKVEVRLTAHLQGYSQPLPPIRLQFPQPKENSMTASEVKACFEANFPAPSNPNSVVPIWTGRFGNDGLPPPPSFTTVQDAYDWIAANWTSSNPCDK